jgi:hypothetical protein
MRLTIASTSYSTLYFLYYIQLVLNLTVTSMYRNTVMFILKTFPHGIHGFYESY